MKQHPHRWIDWGILVIFFMVALACGCETTAAAQTTYDPPSGRGPIVILISGSSGPSNYRSYAAEVAKLGYYAVLLDGEQYFRLDSRALRSTIEKTQKFPKAHIFCPSARAEKLPKENFVCYILKSCFWHFLSDPIV